MNRIPLAAALATAALMLSCAGAPPSQSSFLPAGNGATGGTIQAGGSTQGGGSTGTGGTGTAGNGGAGLTSYACDPSTTGWVVAGSGVTPASNRSPFTVAGYMAQPRAGHTATALADGTVLIIDGGQLDIDDLLVSFAEAERFDPATGNFTPTGKPCLAREFHTATLLKNGKVLIAGGNEFSGYPTWLVASATAELYDPATGTFSATGSMTTGRKSHTATLLTDGRVLIVGGSTAASAAAEIYDPVTETFSATVGAPTLRVGHTATLLPSGDVLIVGGQDDQGALASAELYHSRTGSFSPTGSMSWARAGHTATLLGDGRVLIAGGAGGKVLVTGGIDVSVSPESTTEVYDPQTGLFASAASMSTGRVGHSATLLSDETVLVTGGFKTYSGGISGDGYEAYNTAEIYDPATASFHAISPMNTTRFWHTATLLPDGSVLIAGGIGADLVEASAEIYK